jgi:hypothetical protein
MGKTKINCYLPGPRHETARPGRLGLGIRTGPGPVWVYNFFFKFYSQLTISRRSLVAIEMKITRLYDVSFKREHFKPNLISFHSFHSISKINATQSK